MSDTMESTAVDQVAVLSTNVDKLQSALRRLNNPTLAGYIFEAIGAGARWDDDIVTNVGDAIECLNNIRNVPDNYCVSKTMLLNARVPADEVKRFAGLTGDSFYNVFTATILTGRKAVKAYVPFVKPRT